VSLLSTKKKAFAVLKSFCDDWSSEPRAAREDRGQHARRRGPRPQQRTSASQLAFGRTKCKDSDVTNRAFWLNELETAFASRSVVWLGGVRRVGKTTLARSLPGVRYFDCELVRIRHALEDAELFWRDQPAGINCRSRRNPSTDESV